MFWSTKEHAKYLTDGVPRIRAGTAVPPNAVNLAYAYAPLPSVEKNVKIVDTAGLIPENVLSQSVLAYSDTRGLIHNLAGATEIQGDRFLVTDTFKDNIPLPYMARLKYCIYARGEDVNIEVGNEYGKPVDTKWLIKLVSVTGVRDLYYLDLYTENAGLLYITYDAVDKSQGEPVIYPEFREQIQPVPLFTRSDDLAAVIGGAEGRFYQGRGMSFGSSVLYVPTRVVAESRSAVAFRYSLTVSISYGGSTYRYCTPWYYAEVLREDSLLPHEVSGYLNGAKVLSSKTAREIIDPFIPVEHKGVKNATYLYTVQSDNANVRVSSRADGLGLVYGITSQDTGIITVPQQYKVFEKNEGITVKVKVSLVHNGAVVKETIPIEKKIAKTGGLAEVVSLVGIFNSYSADGNPTIPLTPEQYESAELRAELTEVVPADVYITDNSGSILVNADGDPAINYSLARRQEHLVMVENRSEECYYAPLYSVLPDDRRQVKILPPVNKGPFESWYLRIQGGLFYRTLYINGSERRFAYFLPEYQYQPYAPYAPYRMSKAEKAVKEGSYKVRLRYLPIAVGPNFPMEIKINNEPVEIRSVDLLNGVVEIQTMITDTDHIEASYHYLETCITYKGYTDADGNFHHLDINPGPNHFHTYPDSLGRLNDRESFKLLNKTIYIYLWPAGEIVNDNLVDFNRTCIRHSFEPMNDTNAILLGQVMVRPHITSEDLVLYDTRVRGGGVKPELVDIAPKIEPETEYYWDIGYFDGKPYMENGVGIVKIDSRVLKEHGGKFTREEVEKIVEGYMAWGSLPIIEYEDMPEKLLERPGRATVEGASSSSLLITPNHPMVDIVLAEEE